MIHVWKYGMTARGCSPGCQPQGFLWFDEDDYYYNVLCYNRELSENDMDTFDLEYVDDYWWE